MTNTNNEIMVIDRNEIAAVSVLDALNNPGAAFYCSIPNDGSRSAAVSIYNAINSKGASLDDAKGDTINMVNVAAHPVRLVDENTGEAVEALRTVIIDDQGRYFDAVSQGIASSLEKIFAIIGQPPFAPPLPIKVTEQKTRKGYKTNTLELV